MKRRTPFRSTMTLDNLRIFSEHDYAKYDIPTTTHAYYQFHPEAESSE